MILRAKALPLIAVVGLFVVGCDGNSRFPICKTDADCVTSEGQPLPGSICYDLRCVQCGNDTHCKVGEVCSLQTKECQSLGGGPKPEEPASTSGEGGWEPSSWKECAKDCKDEGCIEECGKKFKEDEPEQ